jgi:hypothetical protein
MKNTAPHKRHSAIGHHFYQIITRSMTAGIIDQFELINVNIQ